MENGDEREDGPRNIWVSDASWCGQYLRSAEWLVASDVCPDVAREGVEMVKCGVGAQWIVIRCWQSLQLSVTQINTRPRPGPSLAHIDGDWTQYLRLTWCDPGPGPVFAAVPWLRCGGCYGCICLSSQHQSGKFTKSDLARRRLQAGGAGLNLKCAKITALLSPRLKTKPTKCRK